MQDLTQTIVLAAESGNLKGVEEALAQGASPDAMGPNSGALHCAAFNGHKAVVALLLKHKANPNIADHQKLYPLHLAASKGETAIVELLLANGANLEVKTEADGTAMHVAAAAGFAKTLAALIKAGANLEAEDKGGNTPLHTAASQAKADAVKALLKADANPTHRNADGDTALLTGIYALYYRRINDWSSEGMNGSTRVKYQLTKGGFRYIKPYSGADDELGTILSMKDQRYIVGQSWGPAQHAHYLDALDAVMALIKVPQDLSIKNKIGQTAMSVACHTGEAKIIRELHKLGASFINVEQGGATPLHKVAGSGRLDGLEMFLKLATPEEMKEINQGDDFGWTPTHYLADIGGFLAMAKLLRQHGADFSIKSTKERGGIAPGSTPADVALHWKDRILAEILH